MGAEPAVNPVGRYQPTALQQIVEQPPELVRMAVLVAAAAPGGVAQIVQIVIAPEHDCIACRQQLHHLQLGFERFPEGIHVISQGNVWLVLTMGQKALRLIQITVDITDDYGHSLSPPVPVAQTPAISGINYQGIR